MVILGDIFADWNSLDHPKNIQRANSFIFEILEKQRNKSSRVTVDIRESENRIMDYMVERSITAFRQTVATEMKLGMALTNNKAYEVLSQRITGSMDESKLGMADREYTRTRVPREDYSVILTVKDDNTVQDVKEEVKKLFKEVGDLPAPGDVVTTKAGNLVHTDSERMKHYFAGREEIKNKC